MPNYFRQLELNADPVALAMEEILNPKINQLHYSDWIAEKRSNGKKKLNRIDKRQRRFSIKKKRLGINR